MFKLHLKKKKNLIFPQVATIMSGVCRTHINIMMHTDQDKFEIGQKLAHDSVQQCENISIALQPLVVDLAQNVSPSHTRLSDVIDRQFKDYGSKIKHTKEYKLYRGSMDMIDGAHQLPNKIVPHPLLLTMKTTGKVGIVGQA